MTTEAVLDNRHMILLNPSRMFLATGNTCNGKCLGHNRCSCCAWHTIVPGVYKMTGQRVRVMVLTPKQKNRWVNLQVDDIPDAGQ